MDDVMWCLTTRVNPRTDYPQPDPGGRGQTFMPAERMTAGDKQWTASNTQFEGGMGIDATVPFAYESDFLRPVYPIDKVNPREVLHQGRHRQRQVARIAGLGAFARAHGPVRLAACPGSEYSDAI
jgi:4-hydroxy-3-polyprenylbenzoate decarboxylase